MDGWISIHRKILDWEWYDDINTCRLFIHFILRANHAESKWKGIPILRGQFITSIDRLSAETNLSVSQIRTSIKKLKSTDEITSESQTQFTVFTVKNYDCYQSNDKQIDNPVTNESQTDDKRMTTNNKNNKYNKNNNTTTESRFTPPSVEEIYKYMCDKNFDSLQEAEKFFDFFESKGWLVGKTKMKKWDAAVRNWIRGKTPTGSKSTPHNEKPRLIFDEKKYLEEHWNEL